MEMNLIPFFGGIFDPILFGFVAWPAIFLVIAVWVMKSADDQETLSLQGLLQIWSRVTLDSTIVMGICGTMIGIHGIVAAFDIDNPEKQAVYDSVNIAILMLAWGGGLAGVAFAVRDKNFEPNFQLKPAGLVVVVVVTVFLLVQTIGYTGLRIRDFFVPTVMIYYSLSFLICFLGGCTFNKSTPKILIAIESNLAATLTVGAFGICLWFSEGGSYLESRDAIFFTANVIFLGCVNYLFLYYLSLYFQRRKEGDFQIKTWHFAEAAAFFIFLVYAPVGSTEFLRESIDQAGIQAQHEAQEIRIEQLEAKIRLLTANQKS